MSNLERELNRARLRRGWDWKDLATAADTTEETVRKARRTGRAGEKTLANIERALGWGEGSWSVVLAGGSPVQPSRGSVLTQHARLDQLGAGEVGEVEPSGLGTDELDEWITALSTALADALKVRRERS